jgi:hypothetical protein
VLGAIDGQHMCKFPRKEDREKTAFSFFDVNNFYSFSFRPVRYKVKVRLFIPDEDNQMFWNVAER